MQYKDDCALLDIYHPPDLDEDGIWSQIFDATFGRRRAALAHAVLYQAQLTGVEFVKGGCSAGRMSNYSRTESICAVSYGERKKCFEVF